MTFAIKRGRRNVAHLSDGDFQPALCGRPTDLTSNVPWGKKRCKDCIRIANSTVLRRVAS